MSATVSNDNIVAVPQSASVCGRPRIDIKSDTNRPKKMWLNGLIYLTISAIVAECLESELTVEAAFQGKFVFGRFRVQGEGGPLMNALCLGRHLMVSVLLT